MFLRTCGAIGLDPDVASSMLYCEWTAYVEGAYDAKRDLDIRLAQICGHVLAAAGAKNVDVWRIAGYPAPQRKASDFDPEVAQLEAIAVREQMRKKAEEEAHAKWLAEVSIDG